MATIESRTYTIGEVTCLGQVNHIAEKFFEYKQRLDEQTETYIPMRNEKGDIITKDGKPEMLVINRRFMFGVYDCLVSRIKDVAVTGLDGIAYEIVAAQDVRVKHGKRT